MLASRILEYSIFVIPSMNCYFNSYHNVDDIGGHVLGSWIVLINVVY